jgi:tRNA-specific 2-thiouridylase
MQKSKVVVGMSGGVDSSVAASLLLDEGHEVIGAFMKNWSDTKDPLTGECAWRQERDDAMKVAAEMDIPFVTFDFEKEYREAVVRYMYDEYAAGRTPNPDVMCNRAVKFDLFLREALKLGADFIATGHYARVDSAEGRYRLLAGLDRGKDQSYFVFSLGQEQLAKTLFPIGHLNKHDVRDYARAKGIAVADKKDSQGICFIGKVDLSEFLERGIEKKPGLIVTTEGKTIGRHEGIHAFTIGQRQGIGIGGGTPYFVVAKDVVTGTLTVAAGEDHPALFKSSLIAAGWHWVSGQEPELPFECQSRHRYRQPLQKCQVLPGPETGTFEMRFEVPQRAITPGQFVVLYDGDEVLGGGVIK